MTRTEQFTRFVRQHWDGNEQRWFQALADQGWTAIDWPVTLGGTGWSRPDQLAFITALAVHGCPLMPESLTVIAPLLLQVGTTSQKENYLASIRQSPLDWGLGFAPGSPGAMRCRHICIRTERSDGLYNLEIVTGNNSESEHEHEQLGQPGKALLHLATCTSAILLLHESKTGIQHIHDMNNHWQLEERNEVSELEVGQSALEGLFLKATKKNDAHLALAVQRSRLNLFSTLFQSLGYYALLNPDPALSDNEPLPFSRQRNHLQDLRKRVDRDEMIQQDLLFQEFLASE